MTIQETLFTGIESGCDLIRSKCTIENSKLRNYAIKSHASTMKVCTNVKSTLTGPQNQQAATGGSRRYGYTQRINRIDVLAGAYGEDRGV